MSRTLHVLVVSGREHPAARALEEHGYTVVYARRGALAVTLVEQAPPDAVLMDRALPDMDALVLVGRLRRAPGIDAGTPIFVTTSNPPTAAAHHAALRAGVWEFLVEPVDVNAFVARLGAYLRARSAAVDPGVDPVTGLYDMQGLGRWARELAQRAFHHRAPLACVVLRSDVAGATPDDPTVTRVMTRVAHALRASGRHTDAIGRLGPTEFAVIAPGTDAKGAMTLAERLVRVAQRAAGATDAAAPGVTLRVGYDVVPNVRYAPLEPEHLLARALRALRQAGSEEAPIGTPVRLDRLGHDA